MDDACLGCRVHPSIIGGVLCRACIVARGHRCAICRVLLDDTFQTDGNVLCCPTCFPKWIARVVQEGPPRPMEYVVAPARVNLADLTKPEPGKIIRIKRSTYGWKGVPRL